MYSFSAQMCVKTPTKLYCSSSPIVEFGRAQTAKPADPYTGLSAPTGDPDDPGSVSVV